MKALQDCIIIERDVEKHELFVLPPGEKLGTGIAIAIGPKCLDIKVGDHVYFDVGQEFKQDGKEYVVMREPHILGVLE
jgi:co-chaperonin GroES (HSP10)